MKRRDFLAGSAGVLGSALPISNLVAATPCPPPSIAVSGGTSVATNCGSTAKDAESDWLTRSTGAGVVWAHDFRNQAELDNFVSPVGESSRMPVRVADGPTGYSIKFTNTPGPLASAPSLITGRHWKRPFSPLNAQDNGLSTPDPAANGSLTRRTWGRRDPAETATHNHWGYGYYGHPDYQRTYSSFTPPGTATPLTGVWDGHQYFIQFRVKISGSRWNNANDDGVKLWWLGDCGGDSVWHQLIAYSTNRKASNYGSEAYFNSTETLRHSSLFGYNHIPEQGQSKLLLPGSEWASTCDAPGSGSTNKALGDCWEWPADKWVTFTCRVKLGRHNQYPKTYSSFFTDAAYIASAPYKDTELEIWVKEDGWASEKLLLRKNDIVMVMGQRNNAGDFGVFEKVLPGYQFFAPTLYSNAVFGGEVMPAVEYSMQMTQVIFSTEAIPFPTSV